MPFDFVAIHISLSIFLAGRIMDFIIPREDHGIPRYESQNSNPLFSGCQPVNNGFRLRLFHPMGWTTLNKKIIIHCIMEIPHPPVL